MLNNTTIVITRENVLADWLGLADTAISRAIVEARLCHDSTLAAIEAELGIQANTRDDQGFTAQECIPESLAHYLNERWDAVENIADVGKLITENLQGRLLPTDEALLGNWPDQRFGVKSATGQLEPVHGFDDGGNQPAVTLPQPPYLVTANNTVYIGYADEAVPFGVVRIIASRGGVPLASALRVMEFSLPERTWKLAIAMVSIFDGDMPMDNLLFHACPARRELLSWFPKAAVAELLNEIPALWQEERRRVQRLLELTPE